MAEAGVQSWQQAAAAAQARRASARSFLRKRELRPHLRISAVFKSCAFSAPAAQTEGAPPRPTAIDRARQQDLQPGQGGITKERRVEPPGARGWMRRTAPRQSQERTPLLRSPQHALHMPPTQPHSSGLLTARTETHPNENSEATPLTAQARNFLQRRGVGESRALHPPRGPPRPCHAPASKSLLQPSVNHRDNKGIGRRRNPIPGGVEVTCDS